MTQPHMWPRSRGALRVNRTGFISRPETGGKGAEAVDGLGTSLLGLFAPRPLLLQFFELPDRLRIGGRRGGLGVAAPGEGESRGDEKQLSQTGHKKLRRDDQ